MADSTPIRVHRKDYSRPDFLVDSVDLEFELGEEETLVRATLGVRRESGAAADAPLVLLGEELELRGVWVDGRQLSEGEYTLGEERLELPLEAASAQVRTEVAIRPQDNTQLMGLYRSNNIWCTQCEAEGFRRITWFPDRPDVMARYSTTIRADGERYPVLLSNGNRVAESTLEDGRKEVRWEDPHPKPSYLFALVAGDLHCHPGTHTTPSGREVRCEIWVEHRNADKCEHALRSLVKSMQWDEQRFGLEYDLDLYMVVAVDDFNMGAMENKGLNVFNSKYVLARPDTATDADYDGIEGVIGHEYFHNWTGNRVTCRDWFQLTLKEGLTVYRDQEFTSDVSSRPVKRIEDVGSLRVLQFPEDAGPMAHPIRPESYIEMNNFYTVTVYEKGAEVVRMYATLLGVEGFRKGMDLYFERHDGQAVTCDDFRAAMADANGANLDQFERWYSQLGTPRLHVSESWAPESGEWTLSLRQDLPEHESQAAWQPFHVPVAVGLLGPDGSDLPLQLAGEASASEERTRVLELCEREQQFTFTGLSERPVPSVLRGFSAPVKVEHERSRDELAFLMAHDSDSFNRWDAGQTLARDVLLDLVDAVQANRPLELDQRLPDALRAVLTDDELDGSLKALALRLPEERLLGQEMQVVDPVAIHEAREFARAEVARQLRAEFESTYERCAPDGAYRLDRASIDRRALRNCSLSYLCCLGEGEGAALAWKQYSSADNMTEVQAALVMLAALESPERKQALAEFYERWSGDPLVLDKWFQIQASSSHPQTNARVRELVEHPDFTLKNPNRVRAVAGGFGRLNPLHFHAASGAGYEFLGDLVMQLDGVNPQVASRIVAPFNDMRRFDAARQDLMRAQLERIAGREGLSKDVFEIVQRALGEGVAV